MKRPDVGTVLWTVHEHLYYAPDHVAPLKEYVVLPSVVTGYYKGGYVEICMSCRVPGSYDGTAYPTPIRRRMSDLGKTVFFTVQEAVGLAKKLTEDHERIWGWCDEPLRRLWEKEETWRE